MLENESVLIEIPAEVISDLSLESYDVWCEADKYANDDVLAGEDLSGVYCDGFEKGVAVALKYVSEHKSL